ncbi:hypothetical protein CEXT_356631 [Caerostris extrusa]|uniref:Uncharacterized protein n=1 Tax=Caerostris extrusa TaxID=172846 RepID=A0AAV4TC91_CAEEX|nr:hypothetical protein CEXT_356631 [Caerostris extrusa]
MLQIREQQGEDVICWDILFLEEAASRNGDDDRRNVHHIILMLQSGTARRRCHLWGDVIALKKQRAGMETTTEEMFRKLAENFGFAYQIKSNKISIF